MNADAQVLSRHNLGWCNRTRRLIVEETVRDADGTQHTEYASYVYYQGPPARSLRESHGSYCPEYDEVWGN